MPRKSSKPLVICPRCGQPGRIERQTVGGRRYIRIRHVDGTFHSLGPEDSYEHAEYLLGLGLTNLLDINLLEVAANAVLKFAEEGRHTWDRRKLEEWLAKADYGIKHLTEALEELEKVYSDKRDYLEALKRREEEEAEEVEV